MADAGLALRSAQGRWTIAATVLGSAVAAIDATAVNIALPTIGHDLHAGLSTLQWVVDGYALTLAGFLLFGGSLGDRIGRRRTFTIGLAWFLVASAACGLAPDTAVLLAARVAQGIGGALLTPSSLALLQSSFRRDDRARAVGAWSALGGVATAAGPLLGGYLVSAVSWRLVFFINLPIGAAVLAITRRHLPESRDERPGHLDPVGAGLAVAVLAGVSYALTDGPAQGWGSPAVVAALLVAAVGAPALVVAERRSATPMVAPALFRSRQFDSVNATTFVVYAALGGALFLLPVELQTVARYSPLAAGTSLLPVTAIMLVGSSRSAALAARIGPRLQLTVGPLLAGAGLVLMTRAAGSAGYVVDVLPAVALLGLGLATTVAPLTATALAAAPDELAGTASAVNSVVARTGGLVAVAVLPLVGGLTGRAALAPATFAHGFRTALVVAGVVCAAGGLLAGLTLGGSPPDRPARARLRTAAGRVHCALEGTPLHRG